MKYLEGEEWRQVPGAREGVMISNFGRVREGRKFLHTYPDKDGYLLCSFGGELGRKKIHQAQAITWPDVLPNPDPTKYFFFDHIDGDKTNNALTNFRWANNSTNMKYAYDQGLITPNRKGYIIAVNKETREGTIYKLVADITRDLDIPGNIIGAVLAGKSKSARGYEFYRINDFRSRTLETDGDITTGVTYEQGTWAEITTKGVTIKISDKNDNPMSQKELKKLVSSFMDETLN